jgi:hypothetical protein
LKGGTSRATSEKSDRANEKAKKGLPESPDTIGRQG